MTDKTKITIPPTPLPKLLTEEPDKFFTSEFLEGGQVVAQKKYRKDSHGDKIKIHIGVGDAIQVFAERSPGGKFLATKIEWNPIKLLYGHNGVVLAETEFLQSLCLLVKHLAELFGSLDVALSLVPGLVEGSRSYWSFLEITTHREDSDLKIFNALKSASHSCSPKRLVEQNESVRFGGKRSKLAVSVYRKRPEMENKYGKQRVADGAEVLRIEVVLKAAAIAKEFEKLGPASGVKWLLPEEEEDFPRVASFEYRDLIAIHQAVMKRFKGVSSFPMANQPKAKPDQTGVFIAHAFRNFAPSVGQDVHQWVDLYGEITGAATDRIGRVRRACIEEMANTAESSMNFADLFGEQAYEDQPGVSVPVKERVTQQTRLSGSILPEVRKAYGLSQREGGLPWTA